MTRWPPLPADVAPVPGQMKGKTMQRFKIDDHGDHIPNDSGEFVSYVDAVTTISRLIEDRDKATAFAARCNEVIDAAVAERTEELQAENSRWSERIDELTAQLAAAEARAEKAEGALERIEQWSQAYPLSVFPEPDMGKVRAVLEAAGLSLDAVAASNMLHVVEGVGNIARAALPDAKGEK